MVRLCPLFSLFQKFPSVFFGNSFTFTVIPDKIKLLKIFFQKSAEK